MGAMGMWEQPFTVVQAIVALGVAWLGGSLTLAVILGRALRVTEARYRSCARSHGSPASFSENPPTVTHEAPSTGPRVGSRRANPRATSMPPVAAGSNLG